MGVSKLVGSPINMSDTPPKFFRAAPLLGEQTEEVLEELGYDKETIKELREGKWSDLKSVCELLERSCEVSRSTTESTLRR